jgi:hypothetical protein
VDVPRVEQDAATVAVARTPPEPVRLGGRALRARVTTGIGGHARRGRLEPPDLEPARTPPRKRRERSSSEDAACPVAAD